MRQKEIQTRTSYRSGFRARKELHDHSPVAVQGAPHNRSSQGFPGIEQVVVGWGGVGVWGEGGLSRLDSGSPDVHMGSTRASARDYPLERLRFQMRFYLRKRFYCLRTRLPSYYLL